MFDLGVTMEWHQIVQVTKALLKSQLRWAKFKINMHGAIVRNIDKYGAFRTFSQILTKVFIFSIHFLTANTSCEVRWRCCVPLLCIWQCFTGSVIWRTPGTWTPGLSQWAVPCFPTTAYWCGTSRKRPSAATRVWCILATGSFHWRCHHQLP